MSQRIRTKKQRPHEGVVRGAEAYQQLAMQTLVVSVPELVVV
jgi:hypothetical protein